MRLYRPIFNIFLLLLFGLPPAGKGQIITTFAGNGVPDTIVNGVPAITTSLGTPRAVLADKEGNVYIGDAAFHCIRKVNAAGIITTIAGTGTAGFSGDNGPAINASFNNPRAMSIDDTGNLYIVDRGNECIRKIDRDGIISTFAGTPMTPGYDGDHGPATAAKLFSPWGVAADHKGNVYIADLYNNVIRKVREGVITTFAGTGIPGHSGDNGPAYGAQLRKPLSVAVDEIGNLYIGDSDIYVRKVDTFGIITTIVGNGLAGNSGDGGPATDARVWTIEGIATDRFGHIFILDHGNDAVRLVNPAGIITRYAGNYTSGFSGDNGPAVDAQLDVAYSIATDTAGTLYIADERNYRIRKVVRDPTAVKNISEAPGDIDILPNPSKGSFTLTLSRAQNNATVTIFDICGRSIAQRVVSSNRQVLDLNCVPGIYIVEVCNSGHVTRKRLEIL